jgi:hypothetical protein
MPARVLAANDLYQLIEYKNSLRDYLNDKKIEVTGSVNNFV